MEACIANMLAAPPLRRSPESTISTFSPEQEHNTLALLARQCAYAIHVGSPLYNQGAIRGCADVYEETVSAIVDSAQTPGHIADVLREALRGARALVSASRRAWALRHALDSIVNLVSPSAFTPPGCSSSAQAEQAPGWTTDTRATRPTRRARTRSPAPATPTAEEAPAVVVPSADGFRLLSLPDDVCDLILTRLAAKELAQLGSTCAVLHARAHRCAELAMRVHQPTLFRGRAPACEHEEPAPTWARSLRAIEEVVAAVGPKPRERSWWHEWAALRMAESAHAGEADVDPASFLPGGDRSIKGLLRVYAAGLSWMVDAGWSPLHGSAVMLLLAGGTATLGHAIRTRSPHYAASVHALMEALRLRAAGISTPAPPTYASLTDLIASDPAWLALLPTDGAADTPTDAPADARIDMPVDETVTDTTAPAGALPRAPRVGTHFITNAPFQASIYPLQPTQQHAEPAGGAGGPDGVPHAPAPADPGEGWEDLGTPGPLVCFLSEVRGPGDALCTLVQTSPIGYGMAPLTTIRLVADHASGAWRYGDRKMDRRCLVATVAAMY